MASLQWGIWTQVQEGVRRGRIGQHFSGTPTRSVGTTRLTEGYGKRPRWTHLLRMSPWRTPPTTWVRECS